MSRFEYLQQCAKWAKGRMWKKKVKFETFVATDGTTLKGWRVCLHEHWVEEEKRYSRAIGDWEQEWGDDIIVLATNGTLHLYKEHRHEYGAGRDEGGARIENTQIIRKLESHDFVAVRLTTIQNTIDFLQAMGR